MVSDIALRILVLMIIGCVRLINDRITKNTMTDACTAIIGIVLTEFASAHKLFCASILRLFCDVVFVYLGIISSDKLNKFKQFVIIHGNHLGSFKIA